MRQLSGAILADKKMSKKKRQWKWFFLWIKWIPSVSDENYMYSYYMWAISIWQIFARKTPILKNKYSFEEGALDEFQEMPIKVVKGDSLYTRKRLTVRVIFSNAIPADCSLWLFTSVTERGGGAYSWLVEEVNMNMYVHNYFAGNV
jgi:hypothetical protein